MTDVFIVGAFSTVFGKRLESTYGDLAREAYLGSLADAGLAGEAPIDAAWFGSCGMGSVGQGSIRGQACLSSLVEERLFPERAPIINVDNACATTSSALHDAWTYLKAGLGTFALVVGVEKLHRQTSAGFDAFKAGIDQLNPDRWQAYFKAAGEVVGKPFATGADRSVFMDTYAMQAAWHMQAHGTTARQIAMAAAKAHNFGADNPRAQYRFRMNADDVLNDRVITEPLTRSMCAPIGDGAAALLLATVDGLAALDKHRRDRAVRIRAIALAGGKYRRLDEPGLSSVAAQRAYRLAGLTPADIDVAEVHDATSFSEIYQAEMLGFCDRGRGGALVESGDTGLGGRIPMNTSGGLVSKGHPIAATGASMVAELVEQLRGEAGSRQVRDARIALAENGGGVMGFDEAVAVVTILEGP